MFKILMENWRFFINEASSECPNGLKWDDETSDCVPIDPFHKELGSGSDHDFPHHPKLNIGAGDGYDNLEDLIGSEEISDDEALKGITGELPTKSGLKVLWDMYQNIPGAVRDEDYKKYEKKFFELEKEKMITLGDWPKVLNPKTYKNEIFIEPIKNNFSISSKFGHDRSKTPGGDSHRAIDQRVPVDTKIQASAYGIVERVGINKKRFDAYSILLAQKLLKENFSFSQSKVNPKMMKKYFEKGASSQKPGIQYNLDVPYREESSPSKFFRLRRPASGGIYHPHEIKMLKSVKDWNSLKATIKKIFKKDSIADLIRIKRAHYKFFPIGGISLIVNYNLESPFQGTRAVSFFYGHISDIFVKQGQPVYPGQIIALSGGTAVFDSPDHLHLQIVPAGKSHSNKSARLDPQKIIPSLSVDLKNIERLIASIKRRPKQKRRRPNIRIRKK